MSNPKYLANRPKYAQQAVDEITLAREAVLLAMRGTPANSPLLNILRNATIYLDNALTTMRVAKVIIDKEATK